jgi:hypothetical protein
MPSSRKINLEKVRAALDTGVPKMRRFDFARRSAALGPFAAGCWGISAYQRAPADHHFNQRRRKFLAEQQLRRFPNDWQLG